MCENHLDSSRDVTQNEFCNYCKHSTCNVIKASNGSRYNWYCEQGKSIRMLEISAPKNFKVEVPDWCPLAKEGEKAKTDPTFASMKRKDEIIAKMPPMIKWEDIEANQVYHIPPICGWERADIWIKTKTQYSCTYVELKKHINLASAPIKYLYPNSKMAKFIVPHLNMNVEIKTQN